MHPEFWRGKRVFLTGHTGFKGSWLSIWLAEMGSTVKGFALDPPTNPCLFDEARICEFIDSDRGDIRDLDAVVNSMKAFKPDVVFHMAAQPLVRYSYSAPLETYATNVLGTANVLEAVRIVGSARVVVNITTDKCYENREWVWGYREDEPLGGFDPYSSSKACSELVTSSYRRSFLEHLGIELASARAGNVIGGGDWATDRLVPDVLRAFTAGESVVLRNPQSIRPWQHVLEPLGGYLTLAHRLWTEPKKYSAAWNFGPEDQDARPVSWVVEKIAEHWNGSASWKLEPGVHPHEARYLKLDISKAHHELQWAPRWRLERALSAVVDWHRTWLSRGDVLSACKAQIRDYSGG